MRNTYLIHIILALLMSVFFLKQAFSQEQGYYQYHLEKGENLFKYGDYVGALGQFELAKKYIPYNDDSRRDTIDKRTNQTRDKIIELYRASEIAKTKAEEAKLAAEAARIDAVNARILTQQALSKTQKIINAFYFYEDQFALAYKNNKYGFINKEGDVLIKYQYEEARPFDYTGLSKAKRNNQLYLIDEDKTEYQLAIGFNSPLSSPEALDLSNLQLTEFPGGNVLKYPGLKVLLLNGNQIKQLPPSIARLSQLKRLYVYNNLLTGLPGEIDSLSRLLTLDASINNLMELPGSIGNLASLQDLILYDNNLMELPGSIGRLQKLSFLDVSKNLLQNLPVETAGLSRLKILALGDNQLKEFPTPLLSLKSLSMLDLSGNYLKVIPQEIGEMKGLTHLQVWNNQLERLPNSITGLSELKVLVAGNNKLVYLPANLDTLQRLEELNLYGNRLTAIPGELGKMREMRKLDLRENPGLDAGKVLEVFTNTGKNIIVTTGGDELDYLIESKSLMIRIDPVKTLPVQLAEVQNLVLVDLKGCLDISAGDIRSAFSGYPDTIIYSTDFSSQVLDTGRLVIIVDPIPYLSLDSLQASAFEELDLSGHGLDTVPDRIFSLQNLARLNLGGNNLVELPAAISGLKKLEVLVLTGNKLTLLPDEIAGLKSLKSLYLSDNPIPEPELERIRTLLPECKVFFDEEPNKNQNITQ
jgi:Leucine-rich repeat (LRR) protein